ncbi:hypothetical protein [Acinetobacter pollinis]|uniref:Ribbon-helix-helix protein, CopG family n=1 Tax=Acinetobacter pollinis TaxID=2605270 RepID=A0ABU6DTV6_9GAMM|nr:hypothetical protein [Acinetobacter pollinis]MEB5477286.1 hypothetical protein [Acinetobacter pollinis]
MSKEKLTESITLKCTDAEKLKLERIARARKQTLSELMRSAGIGVILEVEELLHCLQMPFDLTTDTADTRNTAEPFDLVPTPSPKVQAQKKPNCRNQLSLICQSTAKQ